MLDHNLAYDEVISPIVTARMEKTVNELKEKIPGARKVNCSLRHVARDVYEAVFTVELENSAPPIVARKANKNVFTAMNECSKAIQRQVFSRKEKLCRDRHRVKNTQRLLDFAS